MRWIAHGRVGRELERGIDFGERTLVGKGGVVKRDKFLQVEAEKPLVESRVARSALNAVSS